MTIFQVTHKMRWLQQECRNIYYYETITGNPSVAEWQDVVDEIRGDVVAELLGTLSPRWAFYGIDYRQVDTPGLPSFSVVPTAGEIVGEAALDDVATQVALLVSAKANSVKPNRVRTYFSGLTEASVNLSMIEAGSKTVFEAFFDMQSVLNAAGTNELQRVSVAWNSSHTQVVDYNNVAGSAGVCSPVPATQRRRRIGVGI